MLTVTVAVPVWNIGEIDVYCQVTSCMLTVTVAVPVWNIGEIDVYCQVTSCMLTVTVAVPVWNIGVSEWLMFNAKWVIFSSIS